MAEEAIVVLSPLAIFYLIVLALLFIASAVTFVRIVRQDGWQRKRVYKFFFGLLMLQVSFNFFQCLLRNSYPAQYLQPAITQKFHNAFQALSIFLLISMLALLIVHWSTLITSSKTEGKRRKKILWRRYRYLNIVLHFYNLCYVIWGFVVPNATWSTNMINAAGFYVANEWIVIFIYTFVAAVTMIFGGLVVRAATRAKGGFSFSDLCQRKVVQILIVFGLSGLCMLARTVALIARRICVIRTSSIDEQAQCGTNDWVLLSYILAEFVPSVLFFYGMLPQGDHASERVRDPSRSAVDDDQEDPEEATAGIDYVNFNDDTRVFVKGPQQRLVTQATLNTGQNQNLAIEKKLLLRLNDEMEDPEELKRAHTLMRGCFENDTVYYSGDIEERIFSRSVRCSYRFSTGIMGDGALEVEEELRVSPYTFCVPMQLTRIMLARAEKALKEFNTRWGKAALRWHSASAPVHSEDKSLLSMMGALEEQSRASEYTQWYENQQTQYTDHISLLQGMLMWVNRKPTMIHKKSSQKKDIELGVIGNNLQLHLLRVRKARDESAPPSNEGFRTYSTVTIGVPAAHPFGFKLLGIRQLAEKRAAKLSTILTDDNERAEQRVLDKMKIEELDFELGRRLDFVSCHCLSAVVTSFVQLLEECRESKFKQDCLRQYLAIGFLIQTQSLLSTNGIELGMMGDLDGGMKWLKRVSLYVTLSPDGESVPHTRVRVEAQEAAAAGAGAPATPKGQRPTWAEPAPTEEGQLISVEVIVSPGVYDWLPPEYRMPHRVRIVPVLFTQGINEAQTLSNALGSTSLQDEINNESLLVLTQYYKQYKHFWSEDGDANILGTFTMMEALLDKLRTSVDNQKTTEKNVKLLLYAADMCRRLGGGRITCCKSAKDRTGMSVTYELARVLYQRHNLSKDDVLRVANEMRRDGVRRENCFRNIGKPCYAFNGLQLATLPDIYRAPEGTFGNAKG